MGAVFLWLFIHTGANPALLFALLFGTTIFAFGLFALITGPIATERRHSASFHLSPALSLAPAKYSAEESRRLSRGDRAEVRHSVCALFRAGRVIVGAFVCLFLQETAPRKTAGQSVSALRRSSRLAVIPP